MHSSTASASANSGPRIAQRRARPRRLLAAADVGDDEHVEHHHRAGVDDDLGGGDELGAQQQEQRRQRDQVARPAPARCRTGCAARTTPIAPAIAPIAAMKKQDLALTFAYSPSARSGVRSIGSASSISLVKIRSERV